MIKTNAKVKKVVSDKVELEIKRQDSCSCCRARDFCRQGDSKIVIEKGSADIRQGDNLEVGIEESKSLIASLATFLAPALIFTLTIFCLRVKGEVISFLAGIGSLILYYVFLRYVLNKRGCGFKVKVLRKL